MDLQEPKLPEFYSPGRVFLSAFAAGAAIAAQKTRLEQNLMELDLRRRQEDLAQQNHQDNYRLGLAQLAETQRYHTAEIGNQAQIQKRLNDAAIAENNAQTLENKRLTGLTERMAEIRKSTKLGTKAADDAFNNAQLEFSDVWPTPAAKRVWGPVAAQHSAGAGVLTQSISKAQRDYQSQIQGLGGNPQITSYFFANPNMWKVDKDKAFIDYDEKFQPVPVGDAKRKDSFTVPKQKFDSIMETRQRAYPVDPTETPALQSLPQGMAPGTVPTRVRVVSPDGKAFTVPKEQLQQAIEQGYSQVE